MPTYLCIDVLIATWTRRYSDTLIHKKKLVTSLELQDGNYVISPFSKDSVYGHFEIKISKNDKLLVDKTIVEKPSSIEEFDNIIKERVHFVRENTSYTQHFSITGQDDFEVTGLIEFVHEPACIPYDVGFVLRYRSGNLTVEKTKTKISDEYKL